MATANDVDVIPLSALLTITMGNMQATLNALEGAGKRSTVKVIVGSAPVAEDFARRIGTDGYGPDASQKILVGNIKDEGALSSSFVISMV